MKKRLKGLAFEKKASLMLKDSGIPILISDQILRKRGCGQVD